MTFKGFNDSKLLLDRCQNFDMLKGENISAMFAKSWKQSFNNGIVIPAKMRGCDECRVEKLCVTCNNQINKNKEIEANLNLLKREAPNEFGSLLPYFIKSDGLFVINFLNRSSIFICFFEKIFCFNKFLFK